MFLLAVLCEAVPKCVIVPRTVFVQAGLGFSSSCPTMTAPVEGEGGWSVWEPAGGLFSPQFLGAAPSCAEPGRRDVLEELKHKPEDHSSAHNVPLSSLLPTSGANGCLQKFAFSIETAAGRQLNMRLMGLLN